jgi:hypothetical protein
LEINENGSDSHSGIGRAGVMTAKEKLSALVHKQTIYEVNWFPGAKQF